jgi:sulfur-oxidizing protein SoxY
MNQLRRSFLKTIGYAGACAVAGYAGLLRPVAAWAADWNKKAFDARTLKDAMASIGAGNAVRSKDISITAPDIAENGAVVPVDISSNIPGTTSIAIVIDKNPQPLTAVFNLPAGTKPVISTRVKLKETSPIKAVITAGGKTYVAQKEVKVTLGGCGG